MNSQAHRDYLNRYYRHVRHIYDLSRRYYLLGRHRTLERLLAEPWDRLVEVGPGTGMNLAYLHARRDYAHIGGIEAADVMLEHAARRCPWAHLSHGFAEDSALDGVLGEPPQRVLFSYCLSMVEDPDAALDNAVRGLAVGGSVWVVDFADFAGLPALARAGLRRWLSSFHVRPLDPGWLIARGADVELGPGRYYLIARLRA